MTLLRNVLARFARNNAEPRWVRRGTSSHHNPRFIVALHGHGSHAGQIESLVLPQLPKDQVCHSPQGVVRLSDGSRSWLSEHIIGQLTAPTDVRTSMLEDTLTALEAHVDEHCPARISLVGYSLGGTVAAALALRRPWRYDRVAVLSGLPLLNDRTISDVEHPQFFVGTGRFDPLLPERLVRERAKKLTDKGVSLTYRTYDAPHVVTQTQRQDLLEWLEGSGLDPSDNNNVTD